MIRPSNIIRHSPAHTPDRGDDWRAEALCAQVDPALFYPEASGTHTARIAKRICAQCPVRDLCLEYALAKPAHDDHGVWGGTTERERRKIRANRRQEAS